jgi:hypothetical protein
LQNIKRDVPKGSILGPLIFLLYINDLPYKINKSSDPILYVDDTNLLCSNANSTELVTALKAILLKVNEWFSVGSLTLNLNKIYYVCFFNKIKSVKKYECNTWRYST